MCIRKVKLLFIVLFKYLQELVILLLRHGADVNLMNGEGKVPRDVSKTQDIHRLLLAAEHNAQRERELNLLAAAREGNVDVINELVCIIVF